MTVKEIFNIFLFISALHGFLFYFIILFSKKKTDKSTFYISLLVLVMSLNNAQSWVFSKDFFTNLFFSDYFHIPWHFLIAPLYYTFFIYYLEVKQKSKNLLKIMLPIFLLMILIRIAFVYYNIENTINNEALFIKYNAVEEIFSLLVSLFVYGYSFHILSNRENLFNKLLTFDNLRWIYTFFKIGLLTYIFWIVSLSVTVALNYENIIYIYFPLRVLTTILIYWLGYQAILQLRLLKERKKLRKQLNFPTKSSKENTIESSEDDYQKVLFNNLNNVIIEQKLFTKPKLNLEILANEIDMSSNKLSNIINHYSDKNFNDYINQFRISLAKDLLHNKEYKNYTITAIGLESGFNSKSTFFATFKKHTGVTPSAYQKQKI